MNREKNFLTGRHATVWTYLGCIILWSTHAAYGAESSEHDEQTRAGAPVTMGILREHIKAVTGSGFNGQNMTNVALYNQATATEGSLATLSELANIVGTYASIIPDDDIPLTSGDLIVWATPTLINPAGIITINTDDDGTVITFTQAGVYMVTGQGLFTADSTDATLSGITAAGSATIDGTTTPETVTESIVVGTGFSVGFAFTQLVQVTAANQTLTYEPAFVGTDATITNLRLFITRLS